MVSLVKSLRARLFLILIIVGLIPIMALKSGMLRNYKYQMIRQRGELLKGRGEMIAEDLIKSGYLTGNASEQIGNEINQLGRLWEGRVVVLDGTFQIVFDTYDIDTGKVILAPQVLRAFNGQTQGDAVYNEENQFLEVTVPVKNSGDGQMQGLIIVSVPTDEIRSGVAQLNTSVYLLQAFLILSVILAAFFTSALIVKPFRKVTASLNQQGLSPDEQISIPDYTETQLLAQAYNEMSARMEAQEASRQEFVSNVSHELKTPLAGMKVLADSLLSQEEVPNDLYREFMTDMSQEIDRENKIISDLLSLVKTDRKSADLNIKETNINDLIDLILKRLRPIANQQNVELVLEKYRPVLAQVDETKLTLAISNLVENAIKYNRAEGGWVHVSLNMDATYCYIKVEDSGIGIPEKDQQFIFERFYRVDKSHSREIGGTGLGLAISRSIVRLHNGELRVYSKEGEGTTFTMRIPLYYVREN